MPRKPCALEKALNKALVGARIKEIRLDAVKDDFGDEYYRPTIFFEDGSALALTVAEAQVNDHVEYGIMPTHVKSSGRR
jgi:hypothetical protein